MDRDSILLVNDARQHLYGVIWHVFSEPASPIQLDVVFGETTFLALDLFKEYDCEDYTLALENLHEQKKLLGSWDIGRVAQEYTNLFIGPMNVIAPQYESIYVSSRRVMFQESTLEVRRFFSDEGYVFTGYPKEPDDSLTAELDFIRQLSSRLSQSVENNDWPEGIRLIDVQARFLEQHLLVWIEAFSKAIREAKASVYYTALAAITAAFLKVDHKVLGEIRQALAAADS